MITIINYGLGNLGSIQNMLKYIGIESKIENDPDQLKNSRKIILPGVGAFDTAVNKIKEKGLFEVLNEKALKEQIPILGICLGMQLMTNGSEEGKEKGFGWVNAKTLSFKNNINIEFKIPHMGWNTVKKSNNDFLTQGLDEGRFYFLHSYFVKVNDKKNSILKSYYGIEFDSAINKDNIYGVQFHPEKSHKFGIKLFENFASL